MLEIVVVLGSWCKPRLCPALVRLRKCAGVPDKTQDKKSDAMQVDDLFFLPMLDGKFYHIENKTFFGCTHNLALFGGVPILAIRFPSADIR
jgi:hypothetical protein